MHFRSLCCIAVPFLALLLCACSRTDSSGELSDAETVPAALTAVSEIPQTEQTETVLTAPVQVTQQHTQTYTLPLTEVIEVTRYTAPAETEVPYQGGEGDEAHAETPAPEYFTYRFMPNGISVRLAGGTYQNLRCDLSASIGSGIEGLFQLPDCNFDGQSDLLVPVFISETDITYAAFCWEESRLAFSDAPVFLSNPIIHPETEQIICLTQDSDTKAHVSVFKWEDNTLTEILTFSADYETKQLDADGTFQEYESEEELTKALLSFHV